MCVFNSFYGERHESPAKNRAAIFCPVNSIVMQILLLFAVETSPIPNMAHQSEQHPYASELDNDSKW
jgi:hypothetical protein